MVKAKKVTKASSDGDGFMSLTTGTQNKDGGAPSSSGQDSKVLYIGYDNKRGSNLVYYCAVKEITYIVDYRTCRHLPHGFYEKQLLGEYHAHAGKQDVKIWPP